MYSSKTTNALQVAYPKLSSISRNQPLKNRYAQLKRICSANKTPGIPDTSGGVESEEELKAIMMALNKVGHHVEDSKTSLLWPQPMVLNKK